MQRVKRSSYLFFLIEDRKIFDPEAFLRGQIDLSTQPEIVALTPYFASEQAIEPADLELLTRVPAETWSPVSQLRRESRLDLDRLERLVARGLLLSDGDDPASARVRRFEELLTEGHWHPLAALYHFKSREPDEGFEGSELDARKLEKNADDDAAAFLERHGAPPEPFHRRRGLDEQLHLPLVEKSGRFYDLLRSRKTVRAFDSSRSLSLEQLSCLLRYVFGCQGTVRLSDALLLQKTSPSGGSLHPIEAYPLVLDVEGLDPGLFHYNCRDHSLEPLQGLEVESARRLAVEIGAGQQFVGDAHVLVLMTARFPRNHWKYRRRSRTYSVMLMDAGHLSQTFYLVANDLGLGAFYTAAVDGSRLEEALGLEAAEEGAIGICGCGVRSRDSDLGLAFRPFEPRSTEL